MVHWTKPLHIEKDKTNNAHWICFNQHDHPKECLLGYITLCPWLYLPISVGFGILSFLLRLEFFFLTLSNLCTFIIMGLVKFSENREWEVTFNAKRWSKIGQQQAASEISAEFLLKAWIPCCMRKWLFWGYDWGN